MTPAEPRHIGRNVAGMDRIGLVRLVRVLTTERDNARHAARYWRSLTVQDWRLWSPQQTRDYAQAVLDEIGIDPKWRDHRDALAHELDASKRPQPQNLVHLPKAGPRCWRGQKACGKPLREDGLCPRHDARKIRATRQEAS